MTLRPRAEYETVWVEEYQKFRGVDPKWKLIQTAHHVWKNERDRIIKDDKSNCKRDGTIWFRVRNNFTFTIDSGATTTSD